MSLASALPVSGGQGCRVFSPTRRVALVNAGNLARFGGQGCRRRLRDRPESPAQPAVVLWGRLDGDLPAGGAKRAENGVCAENGWRVRPVEARETGQGHLATLWPDMPRGRAGGQLRGWVKGGDYPASRRCRRHRNLLV